MEAKDPLSLTEIERQLLGEQIDATVAAYATGGEVVISFGAKVKDGPVHCFVEFAAGVLTEPEEELITEDMRLNAEV